MSRLEALIEAARDLEHSAEFNMTIVDRWPIAARRENTRLIEQSRALWDQVDAIRKNER